MVLNVKVGHDFLKNRLSIVTETIFTTPIYFYPPIISRLWLKADLSSSSVNKIHPRRWELIQCIFLWHLDHIIITHPDFCMIKATSVCKSTIQLIHFINKNIGKIRSLSTPILDASLARLPAFSKIRRVISVSAYRLGFINNFIIKYFNQNFSVLCHLSSVFCLCIFSHFVSYE